MSFTSIATKVTGDDNSNLALTIPPQVPSPTAVALSNMASLQPALAHSSLQLITLQPNATDIKVQQAVQDVDSDDELPEIEKLVIFKRAGSLPASCMTIPCADYNIKGSVLITIMHELIVGHYNEAINVACEYEKDIDGTLLSPPKLDQGILSIERPIDWLMSLGGWKGRMPQKEVPAYFFQRERFTGVEVYNNGITFDIVDDRMHLPERFSINGFDVTISWKQDGDGNWTKVRKTDLSYPQIVKAIQSIKTQFELNDSQVAELQLFAFNRAVDLPEFFSKVPKENQEKILQFLDFLNALMFGIEASGLNAALVTGLMTLDLIRDGKLDYATAFKANSDGGAYPFACYGNNKGSYAAREQVLFHDSDHPMSMKEFRQNPSLSPVGCKEAMIATEWLRCNSVLNKNHSHEEQLSTIRRAMEDLFAHYTFPWMRRDYIIQKFAQ